MAETLNPGFTDISPVFEAEFKDMTLEEVRGEDLEKTREDLISTIAEELTIQEKLNTLSNFWGPPLYASLFSPLPM